MINNVQTLTTKYSYIVKLTTNKYIHISITTNVLINKEHFIKVQFFVQFLMYNIKHFTRIITRTNHTTTIFLYYFY